MLQADQLFFSRLQLTNQLRLFFDQHAPLILYCFSLSLQLFILPRQLLDIVLPLKALVRTAVSIYDYGSVVIRDFNAPPMYAFSCSLPLAARASPS